MSPIHVILHPTDFSDRSGHAFRLACALARDYGARLIVLHVAEPPPFVYGEGVLPPDSESLLQVVHEARAQLNRLSTPDANVRAERQLETGEPASEILRVARDVPADLIVMGTHGRTGLARLLMGSVAEQVVRKSTCPVLTVTTPLTEATPTGATLQGATTA
jgi:nucleotide-binding universal stress UspA family protein